ncbi:OLC1v1028822C1 [Oldenlandia corymbosa var. corymbosa]|uniref:Hexosyltransferase n=1 Tax=Oldenlandia corymbosa var. corymbosa TaxID=529605 RepID=A0AAV1CFG9_OLDCO|nr:OLC1v1028822C1 [Oldenlandia corymbosa var. corymbosa]
MVGYLMHGARGRSYSSSSHKVVAGALPNSNGVSPRCLFLLCFTSFCLGVFVVNRLPLYRFWFTPRNNAFPVELKMHPSGIPPPVVNCEDKDTSFDAGEILSKVSEANDVIMTLDKTITSLEMRLSSVRRSAAVTSSERRNGRNSQHFGVKRPKVFFVMGIMTAFSSRKRRDSIRQTWMPQGDELRKLENDKGIVIRFVIGHSSTPGGVLDRAIDAEEAKHNDFFRLNHAEGYHELSAKTQIYFSTAASKWDADFYVKVDDDVHVNLAMVASSLARHQSKPHVYIGCMKSGPVLAQKGVKYHEPEHWKFGEEGNKYFRHATGQIYAISKDLATYISVNRHILHKYANEDVSLGSWFIGLDIDHIDDRSFCCGTPPDCEWKAEAGNVCAASFDWSCSGVCKSVERMEEVHQRCGEGDGAIWHAIF